MRVVDHPILDKLDTSNTVTIYYNDQPITALAGEPIASALINAGIKAFRTTARRGEPRGIFCAIGRCTDCKMTVDGVPNVRTCVCPVRDGMHVTHQEGSGTFEKKESV
ncbi:MAG: (2Fe-2S)-binding protein [Lachnospiraceae bacterium]|nr:(2Fe-2S)-binding protein [Lachnospiraceae bacterium]MBQ6197254.1 (2Fe-2S)-binding protein [Lachnospiraceae bacterium]